MEPGSQYATCEFCGADNFVEKSGVVLHYAVRATLRETDAVAALRRWMAGNKTVKNLDQKADIRQPTFQLFPFWFVRVSEDGGEQVILEPAAALSITDLTELSIPAADLEPYDHELDADAIAPTVPYETMVGWLADNYEIARNAITEASLVHVPMYVCKYGYEGESYTAVVDAASSHVFAAIYPSKWEAPYQAIGGIGCFFYFLAAFIPLIGFLSGEIEGMAIGLGAYVVVAFLIAVPIFAVAAFVSAKV